MTRVPVRTATDVSNWVNKVITYESKLGFTHTTQSMLMCGSILSTNGDAQKSSEKMYKQYIQPYWSGTMKRFFDSAIDFDGNASPANLNAQLATGYDFVDFNAHGREIGISLGTGEYVNSFASALKNSFSTLITTISCNTNAFDNPRPIHKDPCLSESFIRSGQNGVTAYLGCSREGWHSGASIGPSQKYEGEFYKALFSDEITEKSFGALVTTAKMAMAPLCNYNGSMRYIQLGLNPIGDPEMPIYSQPLQWLPEPEVIRGDGYIIVKPKMKGCKICLMSEADNGSKYYQVKENFEADSVIFNNVNIGRIGLYAQDDLAKLSLCVSKYNYKPRVSSIYPNHYIQNETIQFSRKYVGDAIYVGSSVSEYQVEGDVNISKHPNSIQTYIMLKAPKIVINPNFHITKDASIRLEHPTD